MILFFVARNPLRFLTQRREGVRGRTEGREESSGFRIFFSATTMFTPEDESPRRLLFLPAKMTMELREKSKFAEMLRV